MNNNKVKIVKPNKGKHMAVAGQIIPLLYQRKTQVEHTALLNVKFFREPVLSHTFKHVNMKLFT